MNDLTYICLKIFYCFSYFFGRYLLNFGYEVKILILKRLIKSDGFVGCFFIMIDIIVIVTEVISMAYIYRFHTCIMLANQILSQIFNFLFNFHLKLIQIIIYISLFSLYINQHNLVLSFYHSKPWLFRHILWLFIYG